MLRMRVLCSSGDMVSATCIAAAHCSMSYRVHDQRLHELARRAGELRQDEHPLLVVARGDELLRHQVHAVVQARDVAQLGRAVQLVQLHRVVVLDLEDDRLVARTPEALVDARGTPHPGPGSGTRRSRARRRATWERELPDPARLELDSRSIAAALRIPLV
jgi:hypothetical protein